MKLYELAENYNELLALLDNEEATAEELADTLDGINDAIEVKVENIIKFIFNLKSDAESLKNESKRLAERAKSAETKAERLKIYLDEQLKTLGKDKLKAGMFNCSYRKSDSVTILDLNSLPDEFKKVKVDADKTAIKKALKGGLKIEGAELEIKQNLQIK